MRKRRGPAASLCSVEEFDKMRLRGPAKRCGPVDHDFRRCRELERVVCFKCGQTRALRMGKLPQFSHDGGGA